MKRFLLFSGKNSNAEGGWTDFQGDFNTVEEAKSAANAKRVGEWAQIVDLDVSHKMKFLPLSSGRRLDHEEVFSWHDLELT